MACYDGDSGMINRMKGRIILELFAIENFAFEIFR